MEEGSTNNLIVNGDIKGNEVPCNKPIPDVWQLQIFKKRPKVMAEIPIVLGANLTL